MGIRVGVRVRVRLRVRVRVRVRLRVRVRVGVRAPNLGHDEGTRLRVGHAIANDHLIAARWYGKAARESNVGPG